MTYQTFREMSKSQISFSWKLYSFRYARTLSLTTLITIVPKNFPRKGLGLEFITK